MKHMVLALSAMIILTLPAWGQGTPSQQAKSGAAAHREQARNNPDRPHHRRKHRRHRRFQPGH
jgi:hypothetical protein